MLIEIHDHPDPIIQAERAKALAIAAKLTNNEAAYLRVLTGNIANFNHVSRPEQRLLKSMAKKGAVVNTNVVDEAFGPVYMGVTQVEQFANVIWPRV